jgi:hypothetical protein
LEDASLTAAVAENHLHLFKFFLHDFSTRPLTALEMMTIEHHIILPCRQGNFNLASRNYQNLFGKDALPLSEIYHLCAKKGPSELRPSY